MISSRVFVGIISSPLLLLYFLNSPVMHSSTANHCPAEWQYSRKTSRNLIEKIQIITRGVVSKIVIDMLYIQNTHKLSINNECQKRLLSRYHQALTKCKALPWRVRYGFGFHLIKGKCELLRCSLLLYFLQKGRNPLIGI